MAQDRNELETGVPRYIITPSPVFLSWDFSSLLFSQQPSKKPFPAKAYPPIWIFSWFQCLDLDPQGEDDPKQGNSQIIIMVDPKASSFPATS